jgi:hypothetical protein
MSLHVHAEIGAVKCFLYSTPEMQEFIIIIKSYFMSICSLDGYDRRRNDAGVC